MNSSTPNTKPAESPKPSTAEYEARIAAHRRFSDEAAQAAVEGLRRLAAEKKAEREKAPHQAA